MFYGIDSRRVTLAEYRWGTPLLLMPLVTLIRLFRIKLPSSTDDPHVESLAPFELDGNVPLPPEEAKLQPVVAELERLGFIEPVRHLVADPSHATRILQITLRHPSGLALGRAHCRIWSQTHPAKERVFAMFLSRLSGGGFLLSSSGRPDLAAPASCVVNRRPGASVEELWQSHRDALLRLVPEREAELVTTPAESRALLESHHAALRDFHLARGVFTPLAPTERAAAESQSAAVAAAVAGGARYPEELTEIAKLESGKTPWQSAIGVLLVTLALFIGLGAASWSLEWTLLLLPILIFHEGGHYLAMRLFGYRNVRMFFLPLFGAAVTGRSHGAPGYQRALVALAGPLPGIAVGLVLGFVAQLTEAPGLGRAALMAVALNAFNLLPILPLDGGWTLQAVLFCRHYLLDVAFRVLAVLGLLGLAALLGDRILAYLAIPMAIGVWHAWRNGRIAHELRLAGVSTQPDTEGRLPTAALETIIERLKTAYPKGQTRRALAQFTLDIADTINAKPPGLPATVGLLILYGGAIAAAAVGGLILLALR